MESLRARLDHQKDRVLRFTELFGRTKAMQEFEVADYLCFSNWLKEVTGNEHFGINPKINSNGGQGVLDQVAIKVVRTLLDLQAENQKLREEISQLRLLQARDQGNGMDQAEAMLELCKV